MANGYIQNTNLFGSNRGNQWLLGSNVNPQFPNLRVSPSAYSSLLVPPAATPAVSPLAVSGQDRANAFLKGLGQLGSGLLMAGAPTTDPGQFAKGIAQGGQGFSQAFQGSLDKSRQRNVQDLILQMAQATQKLAAEKAAREKQLFDIKMNRHAMFQKLLTGTNGTQQPQGQVALGQPIANRMSGPEPMVMPTAVQALPVQAQQLPPSINRSNLSPELLTTIAASDNPFEAWQKVLMQRSDPKLEYIDGQLTGLGKVKQEDKLRVELKPVVTAFGNAQRFFNIVDGQLQKKNGTADIAGLNAMIKMIDAGMVTVSEVELQKEAQSTVSRIYSAIAQFKGGKLLDSEKDALRTNMRATAKDLLRDMHNAHKRSVMGYKGIADRRKLDWRNIWTMKGVFGDKVKLTGTGSNATLKPTQKSSVGSIDKKFKGLKSVGGT